LITSFKKCFDDFVNCYSSTIIYHAFNNIETISNLENLDIVEYRLKLGELEPVIDEESQKIIVELRFRIEPAFQRVLTQFMSSGKDVHKMFARDFNFNLLKKLKEDFPSIYQEEKSNQKVSNEILKGAIKKRLDVIISDYHKEILHRYLENSKDQDLASDFSNYLKAAKFQIKIEDSLEKSGVFLRCLKNFSNNARMETIPYCDSYSDYDSKNLERALQDDEACDLEVANINGLGDSPIPQLDG
jgi:hypothetical protein